MIAKRRSSLREWSWPENNPQQWIQTLSKGDYDTLKQSLQTAQCTAVSSGNSVAVPVISAAQQICTLLTLCVTEVNWHRSAGEEITVHLAAFRENLYVLLKLITDLLNTTYPQQPARWEAPQAIKRNLNLLQNSLPAIFTPRASHRQTVPQAEAQDISDAADFDLIVFTLGTFEVYQKGQLVENWNGRKGAAIFKYLLANRQRHVNKEELMDMFWQDSEVNCARNNLNVAIHSARHALRTGANDFSHIVYDTDGYSLNPDLRIWVDYEQFTHCCHQAQDCERKGDTTSAIQHYVEAEQLYFGELFPESLYEEWTIERREQLQNLYLSTLDRLSDLYFQLGDFAASAALCHKTLAIHPTSEEAHCRLMRCYSRQGQRHLAQRQYAQCVKALEADQNFPNDETIALNAKIRTGQMA